MNFQINHIQIENFRCFDKFETDIYPNTKIFGDNESGKSTLASAITWALFGKDIDNTVKFSIVPYTKCGLVSPVVELKCVVNDIHHTIKRRYKAKYFQDKTFNTYETETFIDELKVSNSDFVKWIEENICSENVFRILSNPKTFVENCPKKQSELMWQAQRKMLLSIIGGLEKDTEMVHDSTRWADIVDGVCRYNDAAEYLRFLKTQYKETNSKIASLDLQIEMKERSFTKGLQSEEEIRNILAIKESEINQLQAKNNEYIVESRTKDAVESLERIKNLEKQKEEIVQQYEKEKETYQRTISEYQLRINENNQKLGEDMEKLRKYIDALENLQNKEIKDTCPTCGRKISEKSLEKARQELQARIEKGKKLIEELNMSVANRQSKVEKLKEKIQKAQMPPYPASAQVIDDKIQEEKSKISISENSENMPGYKEKMEKLHSEANEIKEKIILSIQNTRIQSEILEMKAQQAETVEYLSELQRLSDLTKEFISEKCRNAENAINALFENVRFELFEKNKTNDEIKETCTLSYNGIRYNDLSASTKIVAGMEVIKAFQGFYDVFVPVYIDNAECLTANIKTKAQKILLYVKREECPKCKSFNHSRRKTNGMCECLDCGLEWGKLLEIVED